MLTLSSAQGRLGKAGIQSLSRIRSRQTMGEEASTFVGRSPEGEIIGGGEAMDRR